jgi:hypothetical protein
MDENIALSPLMVPPLADPVVVPVLALPVGAPAGVRGEGLPWGCVPEGAVVVPPAAPPEPPAPPACATTILSPSADACAANGTAKAPATATANKVLNFIAVSKRNE